MAYPGTVVIETYLAGRAAIDVKTGGIADVVVGATIKSKKVV